MATTTSTRSLHYRKARFQNLKGKHLQSLLGAALKKLNHPTSRQQPLDHAGENHQLINYASTQKGMLCGNMFIFSKGAAQLLMRQQEVQAAGADAYSYPLEAIAAPTAGGAPAEFLESILYFCVHQDHVLVLQSRGLRASGFEQYVDWLLNKAELFSDEQAVMLVDQPKESASQAIQRAGVKAVSFGVPLVEPADAKPGTKAGKAVVEVSETPMIGALRKLLGPKLDHLRLEDALDGNIQATLELSWRRATTPKAQDVLDRIAVAMRNIDKENVEIALNGGNIVKGSDLQLVVPVPVTSRDRIVEQAALFKSMREKLTEMMETGQVGE